MAQSDLIAEWGVGGEWAAQRQSANGATAYLLFYC